MVDDRKGPAHAVNDLTGRPIKSTGILAQHPGRADQDSRFHSVSKAGEAEYLAMLVRLRFFDAAAEQKMQHTQHALPMHALCSSSLGDRNWESRVRALCMSCDYCGVNQQLYIGCLIAAIWVVVVVWFWGLMASYPAV